MLYLKDFLISHEKHFVEHHEDPTAHMLFDQVFVLCPCGDYWIGRSVTTTGEIVTRSLTIP